MADFTSVDVAIIGGGPGGLATAIAVLRANKRLSVKVYERAPALKPKGAGLAIDTNGLKALHAIDPALPRWFAAQACALGPMRVLDPSGKVLREDRSLTGTNGSKYGFSPIMTGWYEIQQKLYSELPEGTVELGHRFDSYEEREDYVELKFKDRSERVRCQVLVGADGYFSEVRQACRGDGPPDFQGTIFWRARVPRTPENERSYMVLGDEKVGIIYPCSEKDVVWTVSAPVKQLEATGEKFTAVREGGAGVGARPINARDGAHALERCLKLFKDYPESLPAAIRATDPSTVLEHGLFTRTPDALPPEGWGRGRVTLIGDAAHPLRPTGQGLNTGLEDAAELAWHLQRGGLSASTLRRFERSRTPRMKTITAQEGARGAAAYRKGGDEAPKAQAPTVSGPEYVDFKYSYTPRPLQGGPGGDEGWRGALQGLLASPLGAAAVGVAAVGLLSGAALARARS